MPGSTTAVGGLSGRDSAASGAGGSRLRRWICAGGGPRGCRGVRLRPAGRRVQPVGPVGRAVRRRFVVARGAAPGGAAAFCRFLALNRRKLSRRSVPQAKPGRSCRPGSNGLMTIPGATGRSRSPCIDNRGAVAAHRVPGCRCRGCRIVERLQQHPPVARRKHRGLMLAQHTLGFPCSRCPDERRELDARQASKGPPTGRSRQSASNVQQTQKSFSTWLTGAPSRLAAARKRSRRSGGAAVPICL